VRRIVQSSQGARLVTVVGVCRHRLSLSSSVVCNTCICNVTHQRLRGQHAAGQ